MRNVRKFCVLSLFLDCSNVPGYRGVPFRERLLTPAAAFVGFAGVAGETALCAPTRAAGYETSSASSHGY